MSNFMEICPVGDKFFYADTRHIFPKVLYPFFYGVTTGNTAMTRNVKVRTDCRGKVVGRAS